MISFRSLAFLFLFTAASLWTGCEGPPEVGGTAAAGTSQAGVGTEYAEAASPVEWMTDYDAAVELAAAEGKNVLVNFTGSDWCPPCMRLKSEVFEDQAFYRYARENLVLLELDFPRSVAQSPEVVEQNRVLQQQYRIEGFPTLIVLNSAGEEQRRHVGYMPGGPRAFLRWTEG